MIFTLPFTFIKAGEKQTKIKTKQTNWTPDVSMIGTARLDKFENLLLSLVHTYLTGFLSGRGGKMPPDPPSLPHALHTVTYLRPPPLGKKLKESLFAAPLTLYMYVHLAFTHMINALRPFPFFAGLPLPCIIVT